MPALRQIIVEGQDDQHVIKNLLAVRGIVQNDQHPDNTLKKCTLRKVNELLKEHDEIVYLVDMGGYSNLRAGISEILRGQVTHLAIVCDADDNLIGRWNSLRDALIASGVIPENIPVDPTTAFHEQQGERPPEESLTFMAEIINRTVQIGVWVMPNNQIGGMLENFVGTLITDAVQAELWAYVAQVQATIPASIRLFEPHAEAKAQIHAWLAWQREPGKPLGQAITNQALTDPNTPLAITFTNWLRHTLEL